MAFKVRRRGMGIAKKLLGLLMAVAGLLMVVKTLPVWLWFAVLGCGLIWLGWFISR